MSTFLFVLNQVLVVEVKFFDWDFLGFLVGVGGGVCVVWLCGIMQNLKVDLAWGVEDEKKTVSLTVFAWLIEDSASKQKYESELKSTLNLTINCGRRCLEHLVFISEIVLKKTYNFNYCITSFSLMSYEGHVYKHKTKEVQKWYLCKRVARPCKQPQTVS